MFKIIVKIHLLNRMNQESLGIFFGENIRRDLLSLGFFKKFNDFLIVDE